MKMEVELSRARLGSQKGKGEGVLSQVMTGATECAAFQSVPRRVFRTPGWKQDIDACQMDHLWGRCT